MVDCQMGECSLTYGRIGICSCYGVCDKWESSFRRSSTWPMSVCPTWQMEELNSTILRFVTKLQRMLTNGRLPEGHHILTLILTTRLVVIKISHLNRESSNTMGLGFSMGEEAGQALLQPWILLPAVTFKLWQWFQWGPFITVQWGQTHEADPWGLLHEGCSITETLFPLELINEDYQIIVTRWWLG